MFSKKPEVLFLVQWGWVEELPIEVSVEGTLNGILYEEV